MSERPAMQFPTPPTPAAPAVAEETLVKLGTMITKRLNRLLNLECAERDIKKQDLMHEILEAHYASKGV
jgi:hypothetical protein